MKRPKNKIPLFKVFMSPNVTAPLNKVVSSGYIGQGPVVEKFEQELKNYYSNHLIVTTNSATAADHLAVHLLKKPKASEGWEGLQPGDEVLTTPLTCTATNWPILANGVDLRWVDVDKNTCNMDLDDLARKISPKTKAIMVVHWGGYPNDLDRLQEIQKEAHSKFGFTPRIIEDCAHSFGAKYKGKLLGHHGNMCFFSFQAIKHLTAGDGGMLILPTRDLYDRARLLRWFGIDRETNSKDFRCEDDIPEWGYKFHMNDINASIGLENLNYVDNVVESHRDNARFYNDKLEGVAGVELLENRADIESSYWIYTLKVERRDDFMRYMKKCNIMVSRVHERNDKHSCVSKYKAILPNLDQLCNEMICIPNGWWVTEEEREYIVECIKRGW
jgi:dTDP-4-amino-4,6-dideoxygalactose transaminase